MRVAVRVDASKKIGHGHVIRCLALAESLRLSGANVEFICSDYDGNLNDLIKSKKINIHILNKKELSSYNEEDDIRSILGDGVDWLVVDKYDLDITWERALRDKTQHIMVIDDLANRQHDCDILLDQNLGRSKTEYEIYTPGYCRLLLGPKFALLRNEFAAARKVRLKQEINNTPENILISLGGGDVQSLTEIILNALLQSDIQININVVINMDVRNSNLINDLKAKMPSVNILQNVNNMADIMLHADICVGGGGISSWERCALCLPSIIVTMAENQKIVAKALHNIGAANWVGNTRDVGVTEILSGINSLFYDYDKREKMSLAASQICDAYGCGRVIGEMVSPSATDGKPINLRPADLSDGEIMLQWQQHPLTRLYSREPNPPTEAEHYAWLKNKLRDPTCVFNVISYGGTPAGVLRLDQEDDEMHIFEISILIAPEF